ncbi:DUF1330 domain-containing protein [Nocardia sp. NPDC059240]|uniref:DUF1330 domain-containing protein n=1 Tax=Nocardia sp. NPDC059240 TaxID=3346786 RepID=UPI0036A9160F
MPGYAIAHLWDVDVNADIVEYLEKIDSTLAPFGGRFLVHGGTQRVIEGPKSSVAIVLEFPDYQSVNDWHTSAAYQAILPLRLRNCSSVAVIADYCGDDHVSTDVLKEVVSDD